MLRLLNGCLVIAVFAVGVWLYQVKYEVRDAERRVHELERDIIETRHDVSLLEAEWAMLNRPERLQALSESYLELERVSATQIIKEENIGRSIRMPPEPEPGEGTADPIGDLLGAIR